MEGQMGVSQSGVVCDSECQRPACKLGKELCLLPHHELWVLSFPTAEEGARWQQTSVLGHANMLETAGVL